MLCHNQEPVAHNAKFRLSQITSIQHLNPVAPDAALTYHGLTCESVLLRHQIEINDVFPVLDLMFQRRFRVVPGGEGFDDFVGHDAGRMG